MTPREALDCAACHAPLVPEDADLAEVGGRIVIVCRGCGGIERHLEPGYVARAAAAWTREEP